MKARIELPVLLYGDVQLPDNYNSLGVIMQGHALSEAIVAWLGPVGAENPGRPIKVDGMGVATNTCIYPSDHPWCDTLARAEVVGMVTEEEGNVK